MHTPAIACTIAGVKRITYKVTVTVEDLDGVVRRRTTALAGSQCYGDADTLAGAESAARRGLADMLASDEAGRRVAHLVRGAR